MASRQPVKMFNRYARGDLVMNAVTACVFLLEGTSVVMLCIAQWSDNISAELVDSLQHLGESALLISEQLVGEFLKDESDVVEDDCVVRSNSPSLQ